jgi:hypothetical protein
LAFSQIRAKHGELIKQVTVLRFAKQGIDQFQAVRGQDDLDVALNSGGDDLRTLSNHPRMLMNLRLLQQYHTGRNHCHLEGKSKEHLHAIAQNSNGKAGILQLQVNDGISPFHQQADVANTGNNFLRQVQNVAEISGLDGCRVQLRQRFGAAQDARIHQADLRDGCPVLKI